MSRGQLLKSALSLSAVTMLSRVLGLVREQVRASILGTGLGSDAFGVAFLIPNLLRRLVAEGAMSAGFIPVLSQERARGGDDAAFRFTNRFFSVSILVLVVITALGMVGAERIVDVFALVSGASVSEESRTLTAELCRWMFPYIALVSWASIAQGLLNTYGIFWVSAFTTVLMNVAVIACAWFFAGRFEQPAFAFAVGVVLGGAIQLFWHVPSWRRLGYRFRFEPKLEGTVKDALWRLVPTIAGAGIYQVNVVVSQAIAMGLGEGAVSSLQYSSRLLELTLGVFAVAISTVVAPDLSRFVAENRHDDVRSTLSYAVRVCCFICFPMTAALFLLNQETASLLFERGAFGPRSTAMTGAAITFHVIGLTHIALSRNFVSVFYAYGDTRTPATGALVAMVVNVVASFLLPPLVGHGGIAAANSLSALAQTLFLTLRMERHTGPIREPATDRSLVRSLAATVVMAVGIDHLQGFFGTAARHGFLQLAIPYAAIVLAAVGLFAGTALVLGHPDLKEIVALVVAKVRRKLRR